MFQSPRFELIDHHGGDVTEETFRGRWSLVFFGFTHCKAVCPRALTKLSTVLEQLGADAADIQPLYISVDPERDTPTRLREFLSDYPRFLGLTGTPQQATAAREAFKVFARRKADPEDPDGYAVPHTAVSYLLDKNGSFARHWLDSAPTEQIVTDIRELISA